MTYAKKTLAVLMAMMMVFGVFAIGASAAETAVVPISDDGPGYIFCTGWEATFCNWVLYFLFFGWIWMWW